jgi:adenine deaminase
MESGLKDRIAVARGIRKADLVLKGGRVVNVFSGEIYRADVAIHQGMIAGLGEYNGKRVINIGSKLVLPGLIDSHVHLESSLLTPAEFAKAALPHGTTAVVADPHEMANVLGEKGIIYLLKASRDLPLDFYFMLPSCVPATSLETSGARLTATDLLPFLKHQRVLGLAEMMNYPGVLSGDRNVLQKLKHFRDTLIDGHAPGVSGKDLSAYIGAGITSDHECTSVDEVREKVRLGMTIFIREGSAAKDMEALLPAVTPANSRFFCFATDDFQPSDLKKGSINLLIKKAIRIGVNPITAVQMATINPARHFGLLRKGAVLPGYAADVIVIDSFKNFAVEMVFKQGNVVATGGACVVTCDSRHHEQTKGTVRIRSIRKQDLRIRAKTGQARVIELIPDQIETKHRILPVSAQDGFISSDTEKDIIKLLVIERHKSTGNMGVGLVKGFGIRSGAIAGTVAHDSHNLIVAGVSDDDILTAISEIIKLQGGLVVVNKMKVLAKIPLPVAGLMSDKPIRYVIKNMAKVEEEVRGLGVKIKHPFGILSFLALPVIPELKLTDKGLVDVNQFKFVNLFV